MGHNRTQFLRKERCPRGLGAKVIPLDTIGAGYPFTPWTARIVRPFPKSDLSGSLAYHLWCYSGMIDNYDDFRSRTELVIKTDLSEGVADIIWGTMTRMPYQKEKENAEGPE